MSPEKPHTTDGAARETPGFFTELGRWLYELPAVKSVEQSCQFIRKHPVKATLGLALVAYLAGRLSRK